MSRLRVLAKFLFAAVLVAGAGSGAATRAGAQNYPWCAHYDKGDGGMNCGFTSFQQCLTDISGLGGFCEQNNTYKPPAAGVPSSHRKSRQKPARPSHP